MNLTHTVRATAADIERTLAELAEGWDHLGRPERRDAALAALARLHDGDPAVQCGHTVYMIEKA